MRRLSWIAVLALPVVAGVPLATVVGSRASTSPGCGSVETSIVESTRFTPAEDRMTQPMDPAINPSGRESMPVPPDARVPSIDGLPLSWASVADGGPVYQYFLGTDVDPSLTVSDFFAAGGIQLDRDPTDNNGENFAEYVLGRLGERVIQVEIGDHTGALVWADPEVKGLRTHDLYWSDGAYNYTLIAVTSPEHLVALARDLVCGGPLEG